MITTHQVKSYTEHGFFKAIEVKIDCISSPSEIEDMAMSAAEWSLHQEYPDAQFTAFIIES